MANDGTGQIWDETSPADSDYLRDDARQLRDLRKGINQRITKEHAQLNSDGAGGEHSQGSAKAYYGTTAPALRPDGATNLGPDDAGRLLIDSGTGKVQVWNGTQWSNTAIVDQNQMPDGFIHNSKFADAQVDARVLADASVTSVKIASGAIDTSDKLADGIVTTNKIADNAITANKIPNASIGFEKLVHNLTFPRIYIGQYTANGADDGSMVVTGVGFKPDALFISRNKSPGSAQGIVFCFKAQMLSGDNPARGDLKASFAENDGQYYQHNVIALTNDGFILYGSGSHYNSADDKYDFLAIQADQTT